MDVIYLDNNATTRPDPAVVTAMLPFWLEHYGNPSSVHRMGQRARQAIDEARGHVAMLLGCGESELLFTGGGTEAINTAVRGLFSLRLPRTRIVTSTVEHSATRELCQQMAREGAEIVEIPVDRFGLLDMERFDRAVSEETALVTLMWANNETGVLFPVDEIAGVCRSRRVPFHCDGTQAIGKVPVDVSAMAIDAMSFASHKFHGPKGVGGLFVRRGLRIKPLLIGGPQERNRRGGTENVPGIVGLGKACEIARASLIKMSEVADLRDVLETGILETIDETTVNGSRDKRVPNTTNVSFAALEAEAILLLLSEQGICASAGAACSSGSLEPSAVIRAMGVEDRIAHGAVRFSLSKHTTGQEIDETLRILPGVIDKLRKVMPV